MSRGKRTARKCPESSELSGFARPDEEAVTRELAEHERVLSTSWISKELMAETIELWSRTYGRPISEQEAVEILMNVSRLAEVLLEARREMNQQ